MNGHHALAAVLSAALCFSGCAASAAPNPSERCSAELGCSDGRLCDRGFCITVNSSDSGNPPPPDSGNPPPPDAGTTLPDCMRRDETRCALLCVKLEDNFFHCGHCGNACQTDEQCKHGICEQD